MKKNRLVVFLLALVLLVASLPVSALASKTMYVQRDIHLNFRTEMKKANDNIISQLLPGTKVTVLSEKNGWAKIKVNSKKGYVMKKFLTSQKPASTSTVKNQTTTKTTTYYVKTVNNTGVNFRKGPSMDYSVINIIHDNAAVNVLSTSGRWWKVKIGSKTGYIYSDYLVKK